jgi:hypothetical protein
MEENTESEEKKSIQYNLGWVNGTPTIKNCPKNYIVLLSQYK